MKAFGVTIAIVLLGAGPVRSQQAATASFCERMAAQHAMKAAKPVNGKAAYEARALKGLGTALFGGSTVVTMMMKPPASGDIGDPARYATACATVGNGVRCDVTGPASFEMAIKDRSAATEARPGEAAQVSMIKNRIRCEDR